MRVKSLFPILGLAVACLATANRANATETRLIAGGGNPQSGTDVGRVVVEEVDGSLCIRYEIQNAEWCLTEVHLEVKTSLDQIPQARGNPIPGRFTYKADLDCEDGWTKCIPITWPEGTTLYIAAHGVVEGGCELVPVNPEAPCPELPEDLVGFSVVNPGNAFGILSYFDLTLSGAGDLDGLYDAWCIVPPRIIDENRLYTGLMICTYDPGFPDWVVDFPENLDQVNYLLNQPIVGQPSGNGDPYTYGDLQKAIWILLDSQPTGRGLGSTSDSRIDELLLMAAVEGEGFVPGCDQVVGVAIVPMDAAGGILATQSVLITLPVPCVPGDCESETAWGEGPGFPGRNWAMYFTHEIVDGQVQDVVLPKSKPAKLQPVKSKSVTPTRGGGPTKADGQPVPMHGRMELF